MGMGTGAGRIDYQYADATAEGADSDPHAVVKILTLDLGSHSCHVPHQPLRATVSSRESMTMPAFGTGGGSVAGAHPQLVVSWHRGHVGSPDSATFTPPGISLQR